jgi:hypothetical protein
VSTAVDLLERRHNEDGEVFSKVGGNGCATSTIIPRHEEEFQTRILVLVGNEVAQD